MQIRNLEIKEILIKPKLKGGSLHIGFLNAHGVPSSNKNMHKFRAYEKFMHHNSLNVFLETGCTTKAPKIFNNKWEVIQNNPAISYKNEQYIHNGKGTAIIKNKKL